MVPWDSPMSMNQSSHSLHIVLSIWSIEAVSCATASVCHGDAGDPARTASSATMNSRRRNAA